MLNDIDWLFIVFVVALSLFLGLLVLWMVAPFVA